MCLNMACNNLDVDIWARVDRSGGIDTCWPWKGCKNIRGYGVVAYHGKTYIVPRLILILLGYNIEGFVVRHKCDNPNCCNPKHLEVGTHLENMNDCAISGRRGKGEKAVGYKGKMTNEKVRELKTFHEKGWLISELAHYYGISNTYTSHIITGKRWKLIK